MKKILLSLCVAASLTAAAQTHQEGAEYYKADQLANAKELLVRNLNNPGTDKAIANYYLGLIALDSKNTAEAKKYFDAGVAANPDYGYNYVGLGELTLLAGDAKAAEAQFKAAEKLAKKDAGISIAIARAYYEADPVAYAKQIEKNVEKARRTNAQSPDIYLFEGDVQKDLRTQEGINKAAGMYEMAKNFDPKATEAYVKYANLYTMVNPKFAIKMLEELLSVVPNSALGQRELANAYYNNQDYTNAAQKYGEYVKNPNHFKQDEDRYSFLLFYGGKYQDGYDYASSLLKTNPNNFTAQRYQFMNAAQLKDMESQLLPMAEALYSAHKANPSVNKFAAIDYTLIADEFARAGRPDEGIAVLNEAIAEMPENAAFDKQLAMTYVDQNNISAAADAYEKYLAKVEPGYNDYIQQATFSYYGGVENNKSDAARAAKYFADAEKYAMLAAEKGPGLYKPFKIVGDIKKQKASEANLESAAVADYLKAIELLEASADTSRYTSDAKEMYNYLGNYYLDQKDVPTAKSYFEKYLQYDPNNTQYRDFVNSLK